MKMDKVIILFTRGSGVRFPIIKAFNVPAEINIPVTVTTFKTSNISLPLSCKKEGTYKLIGEFENINGIDYLKVNMVMEIIDVEQTIKQIEGAL